MLIAACGDDDAEEAAPTNDVAAGICVEGATDCDDTVDGNPPTNTSSTPPAVPEPCTDTESCRERVTEIARRDLASQLGVEVEAIAVVSSDPEQWPDACLDAAKPGTVCAQVITPGFKLVLESGGAQYEYHTDEGTRAVLLE